MVQTQSGIGTAHPLINVTPETHSHDIPVTTTTTTNRRVASQRDVRQFLAQLNIVTTSADDDGIKDAEEDDDDDDDEDEDEDEEEDEDSTLRNLREDDVEAILSPIISRRNTRTQHSPHLLGSNIDIPSSSASSSSRTPTPPKRGFFVNPGRGSLGNLPSSIFTRPRSTSLTSPSDATLSKSTSDSPERKSVFPTFNLPNFQFPYRSNFASSSEQTDSGDVGSEGNKISKSSSRSFSRATENSSNNQVVADSQLSQSPEYTEPIKENVNLYRRYWPPSGERDRKNPEGHKRIASGDTAHVDHATPPLRRIKSDPRSLNRVTSNASILSTDSQFADVKTQVNSRFKAVRDSVLPEIRDTVTFRSINSAIPKHIPLIGTPSGNTKEPEKHPLELLYGQTIVVLGGYRGTVLHKIKPVAPGSEFMRRGRRVWIPIKAGFNLRKIDLEVPLDPQAEIAMHETSVVPSKVLSHIGPVDICRRLLRKLRSNPNVRILEFPYDWRLSPRLSSEKLVKYLADIAADDDFLLPNGSRSNAKPLVGFTFNNENSFFLSLTIVNR